MTRITVSRIWIFRFLAGFGMFGKFGEAKATAAIVPNPTEWTKLGQDVEIFCATKNQPVTACYWEKSSATFVTDFIVKINSQNEIEERPIEGQYEFAYYNKQKDNGMGKGHCGLSIKNISSVQIGLWGCTLFTEKEGPWIGTVNVPLLEKPSKPFIKEDEIPELIDYGNGTTSTGNVKCCVNNGKPEEEIKFEVYFGGLRIPDSALNLDSHNNTSDNKPRTSLCIKWDVHLSSGDDGKQLMCNVTHRGYSNNDARNVHTTLRIKGRPTFVNATDPGNSSSSALTVSYSPNNDLQIQFCIKSNPEPDQIKISRTFIHSGEKSVESNGEEFLKENDEYSLGKIEQDDFSLCYDAVVPKEHQGNHTHYIYFVIAHNHLGYAKAGVSVVSPPEGNDPEETAWTLIIIGIVMSLFFVIIIVSVLICTAKRRGWWCYKTRTQSYPVTKRSVKPRQHSSSGVHSAGIQHSLVVLSPSAAEYSIVSNKEKPLAD